MHWNVVGPNFIGVHEMIDPQVELVRGYADEVAERIATLGKSPQGTPGAIINDRTWDDYSVGRDTVQAHLAALDLVYTGVIEDTRKCIDETGRPRPGHRRTSSSATPAELEKFQWFVRAHLENAGGQLANRGARTERGAASKAPEKGAGQVVAVLQGVVAVEERDVIVRASCRFHAFAVESLRLVDRHRRCV